MNIKIHTMYFLPDFGSAPILMDELASYLAARGHKAEIITTIPRICNNATYRGRLYVKEQGHGFYIKRFWTNTTPGILGRFVAWSIYVFWGIFNILTINKGDILFLRLPPLQLGLVGMLAKRLKGAKVILNIQDIHPDLAIEAGILRSPLVIKIAKMLEKLIYRWPDLIIVISEGFRKNLQNKGVEVDRIRIIPNWVDVNFLKPLPKDNLVSRRLSLADKFVVMYAGTISITNFLSLASILEVASLLRDDADIVFVIVGEGLKKGALQEKAKKLTLTNVRFLPFFSYEDLPHLLSASDILIVPLDTDKAELSVPSKLYSFMAAGKPILCLAKDTSEVAKIITKTNCGLCATSEEVLKIKKIIQDLKDSDAYRLTLTQGARKYVLENFAKERILKMYEEAISLSQ